MTSHRINYEGLEVEVFGEYEEPEEETDSKGGWSTEKIMLGELDIYWMLTPYVTNMIANCVVIENY